MNGVSHLNDELVQQIYDLCALTSAETKKDLEMLWANAPGLGERRLMREGSRLDCAPDVEMLPISSWLKSAMQLTLPSKVRKSGAATL